MNIGALAGKILKRPVLKATVGRSIEASRGNLEKDFPSDFSDEEISDIQKVAAFTMTSQERLVSLSRALDHLVENGIAGDLVECGVWRGGSMMLAARKLIRLKQQHRRLFLFDTFEGMSAPGDSDISAVDSRTAEELLKNSDRLSGNNVWCYSALEEVKSNLYSTAYPQANLFFIKGKVEETLPYDKINEIALLRLDTDWYESTRHELEVLYDKLVPGGILIIDDYGHWSGARKAVDEFISKRKLNIFLNRIDYTGRLAIKL